MSANLRSVGRTHAKAAQAVDNTGHLKSAAYAFIRAVKNGAQPEHAMVAALDVLRRSKPVPDKRSVPTLARSLVAMVADLAGVSVATLTGPDGGEHLWRWRRLAYYVLREHRYSWSVIGAALGGKNHSTVMVGVRRFKELLPVDEQMQALVAKLLPAQEARAA